MDQKELSVKGGNLKKLELGGLQSAKEELTEFELKLKEPKETVSWKRPLNLNTVVYLNLKSYFRKGRRKA